MSATNGENEEVVLAKDDGRKRQWGLGRLFIQWEGAKKRVNSRAVFYVTSGCFAVTAVIGLVKDRSLVEGEKSPVDVALSISSQETIKIPESQPESNKTRASNGLRAAHSAVGNDLEVVKRNQGGKVPPGTMVLARLLSGASNGHVKAELLENTVVNGEKLLPRGAKLVGTAQSSKERLMVNFSVLVLSDGSTAAVQAQACDKEDKMPGLSGVNVRGQALNLAGAIGLNFAGGAALGLQGQGHGDRNVSPSVKDSLLTGIGVSALERAKEISQDMKSAESLIEVDEGTEFYALFLGGA